MAGRNERPVFSQKNDPEMKTKDDKIETTGGTSSKTKFISNKTKRSTKNIMEKESTDADERANNDG